MNAEEIARIAQALLAAIQTRPPLVQNITNFVSMDITANALLAIGASPAMVYAPQESPEFARHIDALVINTGTLSKPAAEAMEVATSAARLHGKPWLLDPVGAGGLTLRNETIVHLMRHRPSIIRGNASEIIAVARILGLTHNTSSPRGVDSTSATAEAEASAQSLARHSFCTVVATGAIDVITNGERMVRVANGHERMTRVTALGCSLSSVMGACLGVAENPFEAALAAIALYGLSGEVAFTRSKGPGSFRVEFIDALAELSADPASAKFNEKIKVV